MTGDPGAVLSPWYQLLNHHLFIFAHLYHEMPSLFLCPVCMSFPSLCWLRGFLRFPASPLPVSVPPFCFPQRTGALGGQGRPRVCAAVPPGPGPPARERGSSGSLPARPLVWALPRDLAGFHFNPATPTAALGGSKWLLRCPRSRPGHIFTELD